MIIRKKGYYCSECEKCDNVCVEFGDGDTVCEECLVDALALLNNIKKEIKK